MARIRSLKPEIWQSPQVMNLPYPARLLFIGLITQADDFGRGSADLRRLKAAIFPGDPCPADEIKGWLGLLADQKLAVLYAHKDHGDLYALPTWDDHQYVQKRAERSKYPRPPGTTGTLPESSGSVPSGSEGSDHSGKESVETPPQAAPTRRTGVATRLPDEFTLTPERRAVAEAETLPADRTFAKFCDYWRSASGASARKHDWDATWRNWCRTEADRSRGNGAGGAGPKLPKRPPTEAEISEERRKAAEANRRELAAKIGGLAAAPR